MMRLYVLIEELLSFFLFLERLALSWIGAMLPRLLSTASVFLFLENLLGWNDVYCYGSGQTAVLSPNAME